MSEFLIVMAAVVLVSISVIISTDKASTPRLKKITQCEKELHRNQKCVLIAVPEEFK